MCAGYAATHINYNLMIRKRANAGSKAIDLHAPSLTNNRRLSFNAAHKPSFTQIRRRSETDEQTSNRL